MRASSVQNDPPDDQGDDENYCVDDQQNDTNSIKRAAKKYSTNIS